MADTNVFRWEEEDSRAAKEYLDALDRGEIKPIEVNRSNINTIFIRE